ncbi:MAG: phosphoribosylamine--glycine ligase [Candidatus Mycalebacterium zealandia]|nr:MAG: phosphoribosylamine--glycine ligase [Candidatus Mycalebacterium zealandia]
MKVMVVGGGGREDALCWKIARSPLVSEIVCAPGNAGITKRARCVAVAAADTEAMVALALKEKPELVVIGPEVSLSLGLADALEAKKIRVFGPSKAAAEIEGSKVFSKQFMRRHSIPTADFDVFENVDDAIRALGETDFPVVIKADGLAAGKGVFVCQKRKDAENALRSIMSDKVFGESGNRIVMEQFLPGAELSFFAISDGQTVIPLEPSQDHKRLLDGDCGPNTGGMGAYTPAPIATGEIREKIMNEFMKPAIEGMAEEGKPYKGVLYAGLMIDGADIKLLEFNCRFGDPETQPLMMRMKSDIVPLLAAAADGTLANQKPPEWNESAAVCVVMASNGYPGKYEKGAELKGIPNDGEESVVFHAGTAEKDGKVVTGSGRVLGVTALGDTIRKAAARAYETVERIDGETGSGTLVYRKDIGNRSGG